MHLREFNVDTMTARRAPSSPQAVVQTLFRNLLFLFFYLSVFAKMVYYLRSITLNYYLWAITLKQPISPPGSFCEPLSPLTGCQRLFRPEPSRCVDQSDRVQLSVERVLRNQIFRGAAERRGVGNASSHDAAVGLSC
jgi:hypothetical protein